MHSQLAQAIEKALVSKIALKNVKGPFPQICTTHFIRVKNGKNDFKNPAMGFLKLIPNTY